MLKIAQQWLHKSYTGYISSDIVNCKKLGEPKLYPVTDHTLTSISASYKFLPSVFHQVSRHFSLSVVKPNTHLSVFHA